MTTDEVSERAVGRPKPSDSVFAILVFTLALLVLAILHTQRFSGDGIRWLEQTRAPHPASGGMSHLLFPALAWAWARLGRLLEVDTILAKSGIEFPTVVWLQWLNAIGGAAAAAVFYLAMRSSTLRRSEAAVGTAFLVSANAFVQCGTDMIEPMWALALALCAVAVAFRAAPSLARATCAGVVLGLSALIYQLSLVVGLLVAAGLVGRGSLLERTRLRLVVAAALSTVVAFALGGALANRSLASDGRTTVVDTASGVFGSIDPRHLVGAMFGVTTAISPLLDWNGVSGLLHSNPRTLASNLGLCALTWSALTLLFWNLWKARKESDRWRQWLALSNVLAIGLFAAFWEPTYAKIWIFGLPALTMLFSWAGLVAWWKGRKAFPALALAAISILLAIYRSSTPAPDLVAARQLARAMTPTDLLVAPGWDGPSVYLKTLIRPSQARFSLIDTAVACERRQECVVTRLNCAVKEASQAGRRVFVFGVLGLSGPEWDSFYGTRLGLRQDTLASLEAVPFSSMEVAGSSAKLMLLERP